ncbi:ATP-binding cassette domain-containing protein [Nonomuraea sp. B19D2]|uniref:ATP-binding cassette domain-containing protein n=1 Tax=Nonomuraea sp. B19D2 TaxID=3159561 RepID=UPI0032DBC283
MSGPIRARLSSTPTAGSAIPPGTGAATGRPWTGGRRADHTERLLSPGLFDRGRLTMPVGRLSTGQQWRLALARLFRQPSEVLLLDEPTHHLSLAFVEDLEAALAGYDGTLIVSVIACCVGACTTPILPSRRLRLTAPRA